MTRKDFELIAAVLRNAPLHTQGCAYVDELAEDFADALAETNPRFDRDRFLAAALED